MGYQKHVCIVCESGTAKSFNMCQRCDEAYDKQRARDPTILGLIRWAAGRARKLKREKKPDAQRERLINAVVRTARKATEPGLLVQWMNALTESVVDLDTYDEERSKILARTKRRSDGR